MYIESNNKVVYITVSNMTECNTRIKVRSFAKVTDTTGDHINFEVTVDNTICQGIRKGLADIVYGPLNSLNVINVYMRCNVPYIRNVSTWKFNKFIPEHVYSCIQVVCDMIFDIQYITNGPDYITEITKINNIRILEIW